MKREIRLKSAATGSCKFYLSLPSTKFDHSILNLTYSHDESTTPALVLSIFSFIFFKTATTTFFIVAFQLLIDSISRVQMRKRLRTYSQKKQTEGKETVKRSPDVIPFVAAEIGDGSTSNPFRLPLRKDPNRSGCFHCINDDCNCCYFASLLKSCFLRLPVQRITMRYRQPHLCAKSVLPTFVSRLIHLSRIKENETFYDLGCGNGSVLFQVAAETGARCVGVELDNHNATVARTALDALRPELEQKWGRPLHVEVVNADLCDWLNETSEIFRQPCTIWAANLLLPKAVNHFLGEKLRGVASGTRIFCFEDLYPHSRSVARIRDPDAFDRFEMKDYVWQLSSVEWCDLPGTFYGIDHKKKSIAANHCSVDYAMLFVATGEGRAVLVDLAKKNVIRTYVVDASDQNSLSYSSASQSIIAHQEKGCTSFFGCHTQQVQQRSFTPERIHSSVVTSCGSFMVGGGASGHLYIWNLRTGQLLRSFKAHLRGITCLSVSNDNSIISSASEDSTCKIWLLSSLVTLETGPLHPLNVFSRHTLGVSSCSFLSHTYYVVSGSADRSCRLFDARSCKEIKCFTIGDAVTCVTGSAMSIAVGTIGGTVHLVDLESTNSSHSAEFLTVHCDTTGEPSKIVFLEFLENDSSILIVGSENGLIHLCSVHNGAPRSEVLSFKSRMIGAIYIKGSHYDSSKNKSCKSLNLSKNPLDLSLHSYQMTIEDHSYIPDMSKKEQQFLAATIASMDELKRLKGNLTSQRNLMILNTFSDILYDAFTLNFSYFLSFQTTMSQGEGGPQTPFDEESVRNDPISDPATEEANKPSDDGYTPQFTDYKISEPHRYMLLVSGSIGCFLAAYSYTFGLFVGAMTEHIGSDMSHIATVGTVMLVFSYFTLPYAFLFDAYGPTKVLMVGTVLLPLGCLLLALTFDGHIAATTTNFCIFTAIMGGGSIVFDIGNIVSVMSWFPTYRGPVVAVMKSFAGLGSAVLGCIQLAWFPDEDQTSSLFYVMMAIGLLGGITTILMMRLPPYHVPSKILEKMSEAEREDHHSTKEIFMKKKTCKSRLYIALGFVVFLVFFLPIQTCLIVFCDLDEKWKTAFAVIVIVALFLYPIFCLPLKFLGGMDDDDGLHVTHHAAHHDLEEEQHEVLDDLAYIAPQYQTTFLQGLCTARLWCIFAACFAIVGSQLVVQYYYVFIAMALRGEVTDEKFKALLATLNGVGSAIGRLFLAWYEWWSQDRPPEQRIPITSCLFYPVAFTLFGLIFYVVLPGKSLAVGHFIMALGNGSAAAAAVLVFRCIFAKEPAKHYNFAFLASMVAAILLNRVAFAEWYQKETYEYVITACFGPKEGTTTVEMKPGVSHEDCKVPNVWMDYNTHRKVCMRKRCVMMPMILMIGLVALTVFCAIYVHMEYKAYCRDIFAAREAAGMSEDDIDPELTHKGERREPSVEDKVEGFSTPRETQENSDSVQLQDAE
eukprot:gene12994-8840_t